MQEGAPEKRAEEDQHDDRHIQQVMTEPEVEPQERGHIADLTGGL